MFGMLDRVHPDAVAEQRAAGLAPRRVDRDDRDAQRVALVEPEAAHELVGERALARAAGAGDAERRAPSTFRRGRMQLGAQLRGHRAVLEPGDEPRQRVRALEARRRRAARRATSAGRVARSTSHAATISLIIPCRPSRWPSSGEKMRATP